MPQFSLRSCRWLVLTVLCFAPPRLALGQEPPGAAASPARNLSVHEVEELLDEAIDVAPFRREMTFKDSLAVLKKVLAGRNKALPIAVDAHSFMEEDPDAEDLHDTMVKVD